jgi:hypothetical protein
MIDHLLQDPDAMALLLLLLAVGATLIIGLCAGHRRDRSEPPGQKLVDTWPHLLKRELIASLIVLLLLTWWAMALQVPLGTRADPRFTPTVAKAPWFFVGIQEMLQYFDAWLAGIVLPVLVVVGLCVLPYIDAGQEQSGRYTLRRRPLALLVTSALLVLWLLPMIVGQLFRSEQWTLQPAWRAPPVDLVPALAPVSLARKLGLGSVGGQLLGGLLCLGPFAALFACWFWLRRKAWAADLGWGRFTLAGVFLLCLMGVAVKVALQLCLDVRYLWVTPWFRI